MKTLTMKTSGALAATVMFLSLNLTGCGEVSDRPELGLVTGTITMDGLPLKGVAVMFSPDDGRPAMGTTDAEGNYELTYIRDTKGCKLGPNTVQIGNVEGEDEPEEEGDDAVQPEKPKKSSKPQIPARYNTKSELEADVKEGENVFDFALTSE